MTRTFDPMVLSDDGNAAKEDRVTLLRLARMAREETGNANIVEVGVWAGENCLRLAEEAFQVFAVDTWKGSQSDVTGAIAEYLGPKRVFQTFCRNMWPYLLTRVFPCVGHSLTWAAIWARPAAMIYLDADHSYESVRADIEAWWPHVVPGGILAGHDYSLFEGVTRAVAELGGCHVVGETWWKQKPSLKEEGGNGLDRQSQEDTAAGDLQPAGSSLADLEDRR